MRVIAGTARRLQLKTPKGLQTRPTTDRIKETLFNMIQDEIYGSIFVDLYAGSGGIGIESLSRGAKKCFFAENANEPYECIQENLKFTKLNEKAEVLKMDAIDALKQIENRTQHIDVIFLDPPYLKDEEKRVLTHLASSNIIDNDTLIIVEASIKTEFQYISELGFTMEKCKTYGSNAHFFLRKKDS